MVNDIQACANNINIDVVDNNWVKKIPNLHAKINLAIESVILETNYSKIIEVSVKLTSDEEMCSLNKKFRGISKVTNVLSFPQDTTEPRIFQNNDEVYIGDIAIGFEIVQKESFEQEKTLSAHLIHLIIHGFLHLIGYDHQFDGESMVMEEIETSILTKLGYSDPYNNIKLI